MKRIQRLGVGNPAHFIKFGYKYYIYYYILLINDELQYMEYDSE